MINDHCVFNNYTIYLKLFSPILFCQKSWQRVLPRKKKYPKSSNFRLDCNLTFFLPFLTSQNFEWHYYFVENKKNYKIKKEKENCIKWKRCAFKIV